MTGHLGPNQNIKADVSQFLRVARERHRRGETAFRVTHGLSDGIDGILRQLFLQVMEEDQDKLALIAVGGYGRRELCPYSDIDLLFLRDKNCPEEKIRKLVTGLWDGGFQLGHSVRTAADCLRFMVEDHITAAALLENRFICGSTSLYENFLGTAINRFRKRKGESFAQTKLQQLHKSLYGDERTIYVLEPHLKEGCCTLRDIQRVLWVENIRKGHGTFRALQKAAVFDADDIANLEAAYEFYLRLRCELHFTNKVKQDILERDSLLDVARKIGYEGEPRDTVEALLSDYFRHARGVSRFLRQYLETGTHGRRFFSKLSHKFFKASIKPYLVLEKGVLFPSGKIPADSPERLAEEVMDIFLLIQRDDLRISESLAKVIRLKVQDPAINFANMPLVTACFLELLKGEKNVGRVLKSLHRAGVLVKIIPEFASIDGTVTFGGHHQFTIDEHTLRTLVELDRCESGDEDIPPEFLRVTQKISDKFPLRLALILHDVGKGLSMADHSVKGSEAAILACERLGLPEEIIDLVEFLIYRHLSMFKVSERRDYSEEGVIEKLARVVKSEQRLDMLYLLTFLDVTSVGPGTWTAWKGAQLSELYERTRACVRSGSYQTVDLQESLLESGVDIAERVALANHCEKIDSASYMQEVVPERMQNHLKLVEELLRSGETQVDHESFGEYYEITFCTKDRSHLFADFCGLLFAEGFNLLGARIFSRTDGVALDLFYVEVADEMQIDSEERLIRIRKKLQTLESRKLIVSDYIREWVRSYRFRKMKVRSLSLYEPAVTFNNKTSDLYTVIEIVAQDRPGLLYDLAHTFSRLGLDVRTAKVSTLTDRCRDVFYVCESDGHKVSNPARMKEIELALCHEAKYSSTVLSEGVKQGRN